MRIDCVAMTQEYSYRYLRFVISESPQTRLFVAEASWHGVPLSVSASTYEELIEAIRTEVDALRGGGRELLRSYGQWPDSRGGTESGNTPADS